VILKSLKSADDRDSNCFNMTPIIDIVFLLIIFFLVVCQFIEAENFPVVVPDNCDNAVPAGPTRPQMTTVTVTTIPGSDVCLYAVGSTVITPPANEQFITNSFSPGKSAFDIMPADTSIDDLSLTNTGVSDASESLSPFHQQYSQYLITQMTELIDQSLHLLPPSDRVVTLRIDKNIPFKNVCCVLVAVAKSSTEKIQLATFSEKNRKSL